MECNQEYFDEYEDDDSYEVNDVSKRIIVGICAMEKKVISKPMEEILCRLDKFPYLRIIIFPQPIIIHLPPEQWPKCDCFICFQSSGFPLDKAKVYVDIYKPFVINDIDMQYTLLNRVETYKLLDNAGILHPKYILIKKDFPVADTDDQIEVDGTTLGKPFVEKPINSEDHNVYIYFPSSVGGGCQRLFRKIGCRSSVYSNINQIRNDSDYVYEEFMPTDGIDVKVYTVGPEYAHAEARKSPGLDGKVERDEFGKEVRYPIILRSEEKMIARKISLAFKQTVCGFDLLRANGKSYVCDVNGFSFVKNSIKYYEDCALILGNIIMRILSPHFSIPYTTCFRPEDVPYVATNYGTMMELRCVIAVIRHGDRTPKQKMKMEITDPLFIEFFEKYGNSNTNDLKLKKPSHLQAVLDITRQLLRRYDERSESYDPNNLPQERQDKLMQLKAVLEMYGHFSGINRKVQMKAMAPKSDAIDDSDNEPNTRILLVLKWGGELTHVGRQRAMFLGEAFRMMYPSGQDHSRTPDTGLLRLHSTYRHDLKIYASDEGRVQMTAAAFTKGLLALEGELAPILVQMVKSANTNGLLDDDWDSARLASSVKKKLSKLLSVDKTLNEEDIQNIVPTGHKALIDKLREIGNPLAACRTISEYIRQMTDLIRMKMMDSSYYKQKLYHSESWELMLRRWTKLSKDFYDQETDTFDFCKISVIYDCIKHDYVYNQHTLQYTNARELYLISKLLSEVVVPQEYGLLKEEKLSIARGIISPLLNKIRTDLRRNVDLSESAEVEDDDSRLDPRRLTEDERCTMGIQTPGRHVRTRLYFTSESHVHSLVNVLKFGDLFETPNTQWTAALAHLETVAELGYLTEIIIKLYEDPNVPKDSDNRFHVEIHFSPGSSEDVIPEQSAVPEQDSLSQASDRPIVLRQSLLTFPINDHSVGTFRRAGSHEDVRNAMNKTFAAEKNFTLRHRRHSRDFIKGNIENYHKSNTLMSSTEIASLERPVDMSEFLSTNELRNSLMHTLRMENGDDHSLEFVAVTPSVLSENEQFALGKNDLHILHNSLNVRDFNFFLDRMLKETN